MLHTTTDDVFGSLYLMSENLPRAWFANWSSLNLVGVPSFHFPFHPTAIVLWLLPVSLFSNWIHFIDCLGAGVFFLAFLRLRRCPMLASMFGAVMYCFCSANFSFVYAGHIGKFGTFLWFAATLWAMENSFRTQKWSWRILAGAFLGLTVSEQPDLAMLFVWLFTAYLAFQCFGQSGLPKEKALLRFVGLLALSGVVSGIIAANVVLSQYATQVKGVVQTSEENRQESWHWATQWSYPPEEVIDLVAPGFFGWKSQDPEGPYWGRTGRSAGYEQTKQGFPRFCLNSNFIGIVPIFLAAAMATYAFRKRYRDSLDPSVQRELKFWAIVAVITLLLAFGKYFILYHFFYSIPKMNIMRNPNKFLHLFTVAIAVLSAFGFHHLVERHTESLSIRHLWKIVAGIGAVALLGAIYVFASNEALVSRFQQEFGQLSAVIVSNMSKSLLRPTVSCGIFAVLWFWLQRLGGTASKFRLAIPWLVILLATVDLYLTNRKYVEYHEYKPLYAENELVRFLKKEAEPTRLQLLTRDGFYNLWLTVYFPYHRIESIDIPQMPRMPFDYQQYLSTVQPHALRFWQLTNCKYLLGPVQGWQQIQADSSLAPHFELAHAFRVTISNKQHLVTSPISINPLPQDLGGAQAIIRYKNALPRMKFNDQWQVIPDDNKCLRALISKDFDPAAQVIVSESIPAQTNAATGAANATVEWIKNTDNVDIVRVTTDRRGILLFNEKHDPNFIVSVDGQPAQLLRCNFIMKGVLVEPGTHEVRFEYRPPRIGFYTSVAGWVACLIVVPLLRWYERRS